MKVKRIIYTIQHLNTGDLYATMPVLTKMTIEASPDTPTLNEIIIHKFRGEDAEDELESHKELVISDPEIMQEIEQIDFDALDDSYMTELAEDDPEER